MKETEEIWKPILGFEGMYEISNLGHVKSLARMVPTGNKGGFRKIEGRILPQRINRSGYYTVNLNKHSITKCKFVHRLIAEAFIPNPENKPFIDHINTVRTDNRIENIKWATAKENSNNELTKKRVNISTHTKEVTRKKLDTLKKNGRYNAPHGVDQYTLDGKYIASYESYKEAHRKTGVRTSSISEYCRGLRLKAGNYVWRNEGDELGEIMKPRNNKKKVLQYDKKTGTFIKEWDCLQDAAKSINILSSSLSRSIRRGTFRGPFIWKYKEDKKE